MVTQSAMQHSVPSTTLADLLERVLDKGIVIAGDIRIKLVDVELLTLQIRLVVCSVEKAKEIGLDWWASNPAFRSGASHQHTEDSLIEIGERLARLESMSSSKQPKQEDSLP